MYLPKTNPLEEWKIVVDNKEKLKGLIHALCEEY